MTSGGPHAILLISCHDRKGLVARISGSKGRDLERVVLGRAVRAHLEHRVLVYSNKNAVFD